VKARLLPRAEDAFLNKPAGFSPTPASKTLNVLAHLCLAVADIRK
jgi:hypothetical protein